MRLTRTHKLLLGGAVLIAVPAAWLLAKGPSGGDSAVVTRVKRGEFKVVVTTSGELRALKFVQINVPAERAAGQPVPDEDLLASCPKGRW